MISTIPAEGRGRATMNLSNAFKKALVAETTTTVIASKRRSTTQKSTALPSRLIPGPASGCHFLLSYVDHLFCTFLGGCYFLLHFLDSPFCTLFDAFSKRFLTGSIFGTLFVCWVVFIYTPSPFYARRWII